MGSKVFISEYLMHRIRVLMTSIVCILVLHFATYGSANAAPNGFSCPSIADNNPAASGVYRGSVDALNLGAGATCISGSGTLPVPNTGPIPANSLVVYNMTLGGDQSLRIRFGSAASNVIINGSASALIDASFSTLTYEIPGTTGDHIYAVVQFDSAGSTYHFVMNKPSGGNVLDAFIVVSGPDPGGSAPVAPSTSSALLTSMQIANFLGARNNQIMSFQPDFQRRINRLRKRELSYNSVGGGAKTGSTWTY